MTTDPTPCPRCGQPHAKCTAHRRDGQPCGQHPVTGTDVCKMHGGLAPRVRAAGQRRKAQEAAERAVALFGAPKDVEPSQALLDLVHWTAGEVEYWREQVRQLAADEPAALTWGKTREKTGGQDVGDTYEAKPAIQYVMLYAAQDRLAQYAAAALKAGVEERRVRLAESQGSLVADVIRRILDALGLDERQRELVPQVVPAQLRLLAGGEDR